MKKILIYFIIIIFLSSYVSAGAIYTLDFSDNPNQKFVLSERDMVKFDLKGEQKIYLSAIEESKQTVRLTVFVEGAETPFYFPLTPQQHVRLDFDRDENIDMYVGVEEMDSEKAALIFKLGEEDSNLITGRAISNIPSRFNIKGIIITLSIIVIGLIIYLILKKKKI